MNLESHQKIILIVEDDRDILDALENFLASEGYLVLKSENGLQALELLKTNPLPNLILLDMKMPLMNGWEFAREFHKKYDHLTPIIVITAAADAEQRARDINAVAWVAKPFNLDLLLQKIKKYQRP